MAAERDGPSRRRETAAEYLPDRPLSAWVDPAGDVHLFDGDDPVPTNKTLEELSEVCDGLDRPIAILADGWRLFHARPRAQRD